jgi:hypothetical protein
MSLLAPTDRPRARPTAWQKGLLLWSSGGRTGAPRDVVKHPAAAR